MCRRTVNKSCRLPCSCGYTVFLPLFFLCVFWPERARCVPAPPDISSCSGTLDATRGGLYEGQKVAHRSIITTAKLPPLARLVEGKVCVVAVYASALPTTYTATLCLLLAGRCTGREHLRLPLQLAAVNAAAGLEGKADNKYTATKSCCAWCPCCEELLRCCCWGCWLAAAACPSRAAPRSGRIPLLLVATRQTKRETQTQRMQCTPLQAAGAGPRAPRRQQRWRLRCGRGVLTVDLVWRELIGGGYRGGGTGTSRSSARSS